MNEVILGTGFGILLGPHVLGIFDPRSWTQVTDVLTREIMRVVLATRSEEHTSELQSP